MGVAALFISLVMSGCSPKEAENLVLEVGPKKVDMKEYERFYSRNSGGWDAAKESSTEERERFLDLLTNYKLKLLDAYDRNLHNDPEIREELREYRTSLAGTFIIDREITAQGVKRMYEQKQEEILSSYILVAVRPGATPEDTLKAMAKVTDALTRARAGENFDSLIVAFSDDPQMKAYGNYYFTAGQLPSVYENAAYAMAKGEISAVPVRTPSGYVIIKVLDRKPNPGWRKVRHMMARFSSPMPDSADSASTYGRAREWKDSLDNGADFKTLASKVSEDQGSVAEGGDLGWFERRRWIQSFDEAAMKLQPGEISPIVGTPWGYHIIYCDSAKPMAPLTEQFAELKKAYQQLRYNEEYSNYITKTKEELKYSFQEDVFDAFIGMVDTTKSIADSAWDSGLTPEFRQRTAFSINGRGITVDTVLRILARRPEYRTTMLRRNEMRARFDRIAETLLLDERSTGLEHRSPEFAALMKEYEDGVVLFKAEQTEVWNRVTVSDSALRAYFVNNKGKFMFPEKVQYGEINVATDTLAFVIYDSLTRGGSFEDFASRYNEDPELKEKSGIRDMAPVSAEEVSSAAATLAIGEISEPLEMDDGTYSVVKLLAKEPPTEKTFEQAGAEVSNAFQEYESKRLEREWIERLKLKYPVTQYKEKLSSAFTGPKQETM